MATIEITDSSLIVHVEGLDKLFTLKSSLTVPLAHVKGVTLRPDVRDLMYMEMGATFRGVQSPGWLVAGTLRSEDKSRYVFCDIHDPNRAIAIELEHDAYQRLLVEVSNETPEEARLRIERAAKKPHSV